MVVFWGVSWWFLGGELVVFERLSWWFFWVVEGGLKEGNSTGVRNDCVGW